MPVLFPNQALGKADWCEERVRRRRNSQQKERAGHSQVPEPRARLQPRISQSLLATNRVSKIESYHSSR